MRSALHRALVDLKANRIEQARSREMPARAQHRRKIHIRGSAHKRVHELQAVRWGEHVRSNQASGRMSRLLFLKVFQPLAASQGAARRVQDHLGRLLGVRAQFAWT